MRTPIQTLVRGDLNADRTRPRNGSQADSEHHVSSLTTGAISGGRQSANRGWILLMRLARALSPDSVDRGICRESVPLKIKDLHVGCRA